LEVANQCAVWGSKPGRPDPEQALMTPPIPTEQLPKGAAAPKKVGFSPFARYRARYFEGPNASVSNQTPA